MFLFGKFTYLLAPYYKNMHAFWLILLAYLILIISCHYPTVYTFPGNGPKILIIGGTHGDEPGPSHELERLVKDGSLKNSNVTCIPTLNRSGKLFNFRLNHFFQDVNRNYGYSDKIFNGLLMRQNKIVESLVKNSDLVIDFHEANYFHSKVPTSLGNTITPGKGTISKIFADLSTLHVNSVVSNPEAKYKVLDSKQMDKKGTLRSFADRLEVPYILVEVCRGSRYFKPLQSMHERNQQTRTIVKGILSTIRAHTFT